MKKRRRLAAEEKTMLNQKSKSDRLAALFILGNVMFNYPILSIFNLDRFPWGVPLLYLYIFTVWAALILALIFATWARSRGSSVKPFDFSETTGTS